MLGELESLILEVVWVLGQVTVKDVAAALGPEAHADCSYRAESADRNAFQQARSSCCRAH